MFLHKDSCTRMALFRPLNYPKTLIYNFPDIYFYQQIMIRIYVQTCHSRRKRYNQLNHAKKVQFQFKGIYDTHTHTQHMPAK